MEIVLEWVKSGLLFLILASVILMLSPNKSYMKHISLVIGLLFILVMVHPLMDFFRLDEKAYISYLENFLMLEGTEVQFTEKNIEMYAETVRLQLKAALRENGYSVQDVYVELNEEGIVFAVHLILGESASGLDIVDDYLRGLFGQEVEIYYEADGR